MEDEPAHKRGRVKPEPQEPPANVDFISSLPNETLVTIISLLPIKYGVWTTVLSRRWRPLWRCTPLDLIVDHEFCSGEQQCLDALSHVLDTHPGPVRCLAIGRLNPHNKTEPRFHYWFLSPALDRLEELNLHARRPCSLPPPVFRLALMLRHATFRQCIFPRIDVTRALHLPKFKHLELIVVCILKEDLERLLVGCTSLEYLCLHVMDGFSSLHITSANVRAIYVHCWCRPRLSVEAFHDIVIENASFLERLSEWIAKERRHLQLNGKGSAQAEFQFVTSYDRLFGSHCIEPLYDFSVADPFAQIMHEKDSEEDEFYVSE
ncbi:F-box/FBD/LRR-repeat protein At1g13570-like [Aegilops tauschii subsp. strangulata]|uniref:F-box/FBD/LRR-repeat protein At1g13570-like n=1 Tax=Aegilops tauschii subsp. strangulata TaxID=200361 RepID=UPI003CC8CB09